MGLSLSPSIVTNGLIFYYDMYNTQKSFKGAPTTNLVSDAASFSGWSNYWRTDYINTFQTEFGTTGYRISGNPGWNGVYRGISIPSTGTYTFSAWFRYWNSTPNNVTQVYISGWGGGDSAVSLNKNLVGQWQRVSHTLNCTNTSMTFYLISYGGDSTGRADCSTWDVTMPQLEAGSFATGFVNGTRNNTNNLIDLTNRNSIVTQSLTYNSDGTFTFIPGNLNYIDSTSSVFTGTGSWTMGAWFKINGAPTNSSSQNVIVDTDATGGSANMIAVDWGGYHGGSQNQLVYATRPSTGGSYTNLLGPVLTQGVYYHVMVVRNSSFNTKLYVNGVLNNTYNGNMPTAAQSLIRIGRWTDGTNYANATIPSVQIYDRALLDTEVQQNFNAQRGLYGI